MFASLVPHLDNVNIFGIDTRCHGYSDRGDVTSWDGFGNDLAAAATYIESVTSSDVRIGVGISSGASAHILHSVAERDFYRGLYLCEPIMFAPEENVENRAKLLEGVRKRRDVFDSRDVAFARFLDHGPLSRIDANALALYCTHGFADISDGVTLRCKKEDEEAIYESGIANHVYEKLGDIAVPTRIVYGETSTTMSRAKAIRISQAIATSETYEMAKVGHFTLLEDVAAGSADLGAFIDSFR
jgi:pimeloyl-ACP methyl ester carboxylesterase